MALTWRALALAALGFIAVVVWPSTTTVWWWLLGWAVLVAADALAAPRVSAVQLTRRPGRSVRVGEDTATTLTVESPRRRLRGLLRDAWQPSAGAASPVHRLSVPAGERREFTTSLRPTRRGDLQAAQVTLRVLGPLGIAARQGSRDVPGSVRALPPFDSRKHLPSRLAALREIDGRAAVRTRGQGTEFDSLRDYVQGDDVRSIDWRATARRQHLVVRTWQPERDKRVVIALDTSRTSAARIGDIPRLDASMDAALLLAALALRADDRVDFLAGDRLIRERVSSQGVDGGALQGMVQAMATLVSSRWEASWPTLAAGITRAAGQRALVVLLTALNPAVVEESLLPVLPPLTARHRVVVACVEDDSLEELRRSRDSAAGVYLAAAAERTTTVDEHLRSALGKLGVTVVSGTPEELPVRLTDHYLALKASGQL